MVTRNSDREEIEMMIRSRTMPRRWWLVVARLSGAVGGEAGMSTAEYAIGTIAAAAFAAVLYKV
jgi:Protein of unknown function (DUF4244)